MEENIRGWFFLKMNQWLDDHIIQTRRRMPPIRNIGQVAFRKDKSVSDTGAEHCQIVESNTIHYPIFG